MELFVFFRAEMSGVWVLVSPSWACGRHIGTELIYFFFRSEYPTPASPQYRLGWFRQRSFVHRDLRGVARPNSSHQPAMESLVTTLWLMYAVKCLESCLPASNRTLLCNQFLSFGCLKNRSPAPRLSDFETQNGTLPALIGCIFTSHQRQNTKSKCVTVHSNQQPDQPEEEAATARTHFLWTLITVGIVEQHNWVSITA